MGEWINRFWQAVREDETMLLATSAQGSVTARVVSPVYYQNAVLVFTAEQSRKYQQLKQNPNCCMIIRGMFAESEAEFLGSTMWQSNKVLRDVYSGKFKEAFGDNMSSSGQAAEFVLIHPKRLTGWSAEGTPAPFDERF